MKYPITKVYEIWTKYGFNYVWKHNGYEYKVIEEDGYITYKVNWHHAGTLRIEDCVDIYVDTNEETLKEYNQKYELNGKIGVKEDDV